MNWTSEDEVHKQVERLWLRGDVLRALVHAEGSFPARLRLKPPSISELESHFAQAEEWVRAMRQLPGVRVECRTVQRSIQGRQELPSQLWLDTPEAAIDLLDKRSEADTFLAIHAATQASLPEVLPWLMAHPLRALAEEPVWHRALVVARWKRDQPYAAPVYLRQLDMPGIDTKFIEANKALLRGLFDLVCPTDTVNSSGMDFSLRYGFLREPPRVRFRLLDPAIRLAGLSECPDVELDAESFAALRLDASYAIVMENKTTYLALPRMSASIAIFGGGYGARALGKASWLQDMRVLYWGDIDTHGFAILSQLREFLPHARSILMDEATLLAFRESWTNETAQHRHTLTRLSAEEQTVFALLIQQRFGKGVRLEQEKVPIAYALHALGQLFQVDL